MRGQNESSKSGRTKKKPRISGLFRNDCLTASLLVTLPVSFAENVAAIILAPLVRDPVFPTSLGHVFALELARKSAPRPLVMI
jgi:hypothetical protein